MITNIHVAVALVLATTAHAIKLESNMALQMVADSVFEESMTDLATVESAVAAAREEGTEGHVAIGFCFFVAIVIAAMCGVCLGG